MCHHAIPDPVYNVAHRPSALPSINPVKVHISVVVVNLNGAGHLSTLLQALARQTYQHFELILVDNASVDNSVAQAESFCRQYQIRLHVIQNPTNRGFAAACNQAIQIAQGEWIALLNNDAWPEPQWLETMWATTEMMPNVGMVAAKLLFAHAPGRINSAGVALDRAGIVWDRLGGAPDNQAQDTVVEVFGPSGGAALYSRQMLVELGGFDEDFFAYLEDVDLAWRARLAGWRCLFQPQARVYHVHSATLGEGSPFKHYLLARNKIWLLVKNYPSPYLIRFFPLILSYDLMAALAKTWRVRNLAPIWGRLAALRDLKVVLHKRRTIQRRWRNTENWLHQTEPPASPWSVLRRYNHLP